MLSFKRMFLYITSFVFLVSVWTTLSYAQSENTEVITANVFNKEQSESNLIEFLNKNSIGIQGNFNELYRSAYNNMMANSILSDEDTKEILAETDKESEEEIEKQTGVVTASALNVRKGAGTGFEKVDTVMRNEAITIEGQDDNWYKIVTDSGTKGWVYASYVSTVPQNVATRGGSSGSRSSDDVVKLRSDIVEDSKNYLGVSYVYGGSSPSGFDCSGFVWYVFKNHGIDLNRVASDQANQGSWVAKEDLIPGDLVFFDTRGNASYINHVGIYIGRGEFIHASSGRNAGCVVISDLTTGFYQRTYMTARKFF
ncbi:SH3 domain-containing C40 family peptidase [Herbivorax sp. ANBcel31]|uniref:C40 family peptidase n=1 Tax=Herbivorax sp. ANBcel31 TaxID=3069754 RepID=UPI0027B18DC8|nr:SH3 domain-containing C40 family peptidase [Herbivorax sp. ANBcel31]MDQ2085938.1 SH3 domain-containing C40 family peptidase [Herbivorax sp. ANBcel31]